MFNKKVVPFFCREHHQCRAVRPYVRTNVRADESIFGLVHRLGRFFPFADLANTNVGHLERELDRMTVLGVAYRDGLYLAGGVDVDVNAGDNVVGNQVNQLDFQKDKWERVK